MTIKNRKAPVHLLYGEKFSQEPMEKAVIIHICLDIEVTCPLTNNHLGRPWLTILIDVCSSRILAYYLSIEGPSYLSIMMTLRESVRKNAMLPKTLVISNGKEFQNVNFDTILATLEIRNITYPKDEFSFYERMFTNLNNNIVNYLRREHSRGICYLNILDKIISKLLYQVYDQQYIPYLGTSPREIFNSMSTISSLPSEIIYDDTFIMLTLPQIEKKVIPKKGIRNGKVYYWTYDFLKHSLIGEKVMVKYDPLDIDNVFAYIESDWIKLTRAF
jgi:hypothetical protein